MKDRLVTFALAIGALALFYALFGPKQAQAPKVTRPVTTEPGPNGYLALLQWFEAAGTRPLSLRERFGALASLKDVPDRGNLLISTAPQRYPLRDSEAQPLRDWVAAGNTLLVVAGLSDTPEWSMGEGADGDFFKHMEAMTGLQFTQARIAKAAEENVEPDSEAAGDEAQIDDSPDTTSPVQRLVPAQTFEMVPTGDHPLLEGVKVVTALSEFPTEQWRATSSMTDLLLELAHDPETDEPMLWLMRYGSGQIIVSAYGSPFTNKLLGEKDNARLLANIATWSLSAQGRVIIDDAHQGLVAFYDPEAFYGDKRLHASLWWLLGLWFVFVLGSQRLRATDTRWNPVDVTSFVRASGGFLARVLKPATAAQQLFANFFNDIRRQTGQPVNGAPVWEWMTAHTGVADRDIEKLRDLHSRALAGRRLDLPKLQNLLNHTRQQLT